MGSLDEEGPADELFEIPRHRPPSIARANLDALGAALPVAESRRVVSILRHGVLCSGAP
jgi:hypothetical protein